MHAQPRPHNRQEAQPERQHGQTRPEPARIPHVNPVTSTEGHPGCQQNPEQTDIRHPFLCPIETDVGNGNEDQSRHHRHAQTAQDCDRKRWPDLEIASHFQRERQYAEERRRGRHQNRADTGPSGGQNGARHPKAAFCAVRSDRVDQNNSVVHRDAEKDDKPEECHRACLRRQTGLGNDQRPARPDDRSRDCAKHDERRPEGLEQRCQNHVNEQSRNRHHPVIDRVRLCGNKLDRHPRWDHHILNNGPDGHACVIQKNLGFGHIRRETILNGNPPGLVRPHDRTPPLIRPHTGDLFERRIRAGERPYRDLAQTDQPGAIGVGVQRRPQVDRCLGSVRVQKRDSGLEALWIGCFNRRKHVCRLQPLVEQGHCIRDDLDLRRTALDIRPNAVRVDRLHLLQPIGKVLGDHPE